LLALLLLVIIATPVCAKKAQEKAAAVEDEVVAQVAGEAITMSQLEEAKSAQLKRLEQERYDLLRAALDEVAMEKLVEKAAADRGLTPEELMRAEVQDKIVPPTPEELQARYDANKDRAGGRSFEEVRPAVERMMLEERTNTRLAQFNDELKKTIEFNVFLEPPRSEVTIPVDAPAKGPADAPVTLVEFADFQCPYCRRAHPTVSRLLMEYKDKIRYVFRDYPLGFHKRAVPASVAAYCANEQGKYWDYYESLKVMVGDLSDTDLNKRATDIGLNMEEFGACMKAGKYEGIVNAGFADGQALGVTGTPTYFINGRMLIGAQPYDAFKSIVDDELARNAPAEQDG
jgi:protein-disulfide isomerase